MTSSLFCLYPSTTPPPLSIVNGYLLAGIRLIWIGNSPCTPEFTEHLDYFSLQIAVSRIKYDDLLALIPPYLHGSICFVRVYLEFSSMLIYDVPSHIRLIVVAGDTHHLPGMMRFAYQYLSRNPPYVLTSYANPCDAAILASLLGLPADNLFAYPFHQVALNTVIQPSESSFSMERRDSVGLCSSLTPFQVPRTKSVKYICKSRRLLESFEFHGFFSEATEYARFLLAHASYLVPTNGAQISPQVISAAFLGCHVYTDCLNQLLLHPQSFLLQHVVSQIDFDCICCPSTALDLHGESIDIPAADWVSDCSFESVFSDHNLAQSLRFYHGLLAYGPPSTNDSMEYLFSRFDSIIGLRANFLQSVDPLISLEPSLLENQFTLAFVQARGLSCRS